MSLEAQLQDRSSSLCELCNSPKNLSVYSVPPDAEETVDKSILVCSTCKSQIENTEPMDANHWRCLNDSMWTPIPAVQVMAWRMLDRLKAEGWPQGLLDTLYLEDEVRIWAESGADSANENDEPTRDSNGAELSNGDSVTLIKDLVIKGANFTAKRGTLVKNISLTSNPREIEGRIDGTRIVLAGRFMKKA